jgi:hypothetical protein
MWKYQEQPNRAESKKLTNLIPWQSIRKLTMVFTTMVLPFTVVPFLLWATVAVNDGFTWLSFH